MKNNLIIEILVFLFLMVLAASFLFDSDKLIESVSSSNNDEDYNPETDIKIGEDSSEKKIPLLGTPLDEISVSSSESSLGGETSTPEVLPEPYSDCYIKLSHSIRLFNYRINESKIDCSLYFKNLDKEVAGNFLIEFNLFNENGIKVDGVNQSKIIPPKEEIVFEETFLNVEENYYCEYETPIVPTKNVC